MSSAVQPPWPELPYAAWRDSCETLHLMTQIVGKIRLARTPWLNHSWHVALYVTARGLTTSPIPDGARSFQIDFDFIDHDLLISSSDGGLRQLPLTEQPIAAFYAARSQHVRCSDREFVKFLPRPCAPVENNERTVRIVLKPARESAVQRVVVRRVQADNVEWRFHLMCE